MQKKLLLGAKKATLLGGIVVTLRVSAVSHKWESLGRASQAKLARANRRVLRLSRTGLEAYYQSAESLLYKGFQRFANQ